MKNIHQILSEKEAQLRRTQIEVEALRIVAPLLSEAPDEGTDRLNGSSRNTGKTY